MEFNLIDLLLCAVILLSVFLGWRRGFLLEFLGLATWLASLVLGLRFYQPVARWLTDVTEWATAWTTPISFMAILFLSLLILHVVFARLVARIPGKAHPHFLNKFLGILPGLANGFIYAVFFAALLFALPLPESMQSQARDSEVANQFAGYAEMVEARLRPIFDDALGETLNMRTVQPQSRETVKLPFAVKESKPRAALEAQMLELVNKERLQAGLKPVTMDAKLTEAAREHSADMLARGYFSHYSPEGKSAFERMRAKKISFLFAGENLAFAPTVKVAHTGLMNSPGHKANILRPQFGKLGIGIMDAGPRGIMVTQKFSN